MKKNDIPQELKADLPLNTWGKMLSATPVVMAVIATLLAGLASSEMTRAQYARSLGAQQQSKAGDQWSFFQAKKLRSALQRNTLDMLQSTAEVRMFDETKVQIAARQLPAAAKALQDSALSLLNSPAGQRALIELRQGELPQLTAEPALDPKLKDVLAAIENAQSDSELNAKLSGLDAKLVERALGTARDRASAFDEQVRPTAQAIEIFEKLLSPTPVPAASGAESVASRRNFIAARLQFNALRYEAEARLNQRIANLLEVQVRHSNLTAEWHRRRSERFFFGMLAAQAAVIISTLAMAARQRNLLWTLAAAAGVAAVLFAIYVYWFMKLT